MAQGLTSSLICGRRWDVLSSEAGVWGRRTLTLVDSERDDKMSFNQIMLHLQKELLKYKQEARNLQGIKVRKGELHQM